MLLVSNITQQRQNSLSMRVTQELKLEVNYTEIKHRV